MTCSRLSASALVADLVKAALSEGRHPLVWTVFDEESEIIMEHLAGHNMASLHGKDKMHERDEKLEAYRTGKLGGLVSKAKLLGYGMNFPFCSCMIFSGFDDSFEGFYPGDPPCASLRSHSTANRSRSVHSRIRAAHVEQSLAEENAMGS